MCSPTGQVDIKTRGMPRLSRLSQALKPGTPDVRNIAAADPLESSQSVRKMHHMMRHYSNITSQLYIKFKPRQNLLARISARSTESSCPVDECLWYIVTQALKHERNAFLRSYSLALACVFEDVLESARHRSQVQSAVHKTAPNNVGRWYSVFIQPLYYLVIVSYLFYAKAGLR